MFTSRIDTPFSSELLCSPKTWNGVKRDSWAIIMRQEIWKTRINTTALLQEAEAEEVSVVTAGTDPSAAADQLRIISRFSSTSASNQIWQDTHERFFRIVVSYVLVKVIPLITQVCHGIDFTLLNVKVGLYSLFRNTQILIYSQKDFNLHIECWTYSIDCTVNTVVHY